MLLLISAGKTHIAQRPVGGNRSQLRKLSGFAVVLPLHWFLYITAKFVGQILAVNFFSPAIRRQRLEIKYMELRVK